MDQDQDKIVDTSPTVAPAEAGPDGQVGPVQAEKAATHVLSPGTIGVVRRLIRGRWTLTEVYN